MKEFLSEADSIDKAVRDHLTALTDQVALECRCKQHVAEPVVRRAMWQMFDLHVSASSEVAKAGFWAYLAKCGLIRRTV